MSARPPRLGRLANKTAIITGSSSGLGRAIALAYASEGANICLVDLYPGLRNPINPVTGKADEIHNRASSGTNTLDALREKYPGEENRFCFVEADITVAADVERAVRACVQTFGRLDIMVNNAGISVESTHVKAKGVHETDESEWDKTMAVNAKGVFLGCKYAIRQMLEQEPWEELERAGEERWEGDERDRGWIVNTASVQGLVGYWGTPSYSASKAATLNLTRQIGLDYASSRIHCNALCPGFLRTAMTQNLQSSPEALAKIGAAHPLGGMGDPRDVARMAIVLASSDVRWVTGVGMVVDGGYLLQ